MNAADPPPQFSSDCRVLFGGRSACVDFVDGLPALRVALPVLAGPTVSRLLAEAARPEFSGGWSLFHKGPFMAGFGVGAPDADVESAAAELYGRLFAATEGLNLYRIWNYVPRINEATGGMENYQRFCRARSRAFSERFGGDFQRVLPSASAVGAATGPLAVGFLAGRTEPRHFENPRQVPAFEYPPKYGPSSPSFSRATVVDADNGRQFFISGTAAIRGHDTVAGLRLDGQLDCTLENLALIGEATGAGPDLGGTAGWQRAFRVYIRDSADLARVQGRLDRDLLRTGDTTSYLQADICRADLLVEVEATLTARC